MRNFGNFLGESPGNRLSVSVCNFIAHTNVMPGVQSGENLIEAELAAYLNYVIALNTMYHVPMHNTPNDDYYCCHACHM